MCPLRRLIICGRTHLVSDNWPTTFSSIISRSTARSVSEIHARCDRPALLTRMSTYNTEFHSFMEFINLVWLNSTAKPAAITTGWEYPQNSQLTYWGIHLWKVLQWVRPAGHSIYFSHSLDRKSHSPSHFKSLAMTSNSHKFKHKTKKS